MYSPQYTILVLLGREKSSSVFDRHVFKELVATAHPLLFKDGKAKIHGLMYGPQGGGKNISPRKTVATDSAITKWADTVCNPQNTVIIVMIDNFSNDEYPNVYLGIRKEYIYNSESVYKPTEGNWGASNSIVLAVPRIYKDEELSLFLAIFRKMANLTNACYGFVELATTWTQPNDSGHPELSTFRSHPVSYRDTDVQYDYISQFRVDEYASRIHKVMILNHGQIHSQLPDSLIKSKIPISHDVTFFEFVGDPQADPELMAAIREHVPAIPKHP